MKKNVAAYEEAQAQYAQQQAAPRPAAPPPAQPDVDDKIAQLERLAQLKAQGILTEEEFAQQKKAILG